jgi:hypothetical protein
MVEEANPLRRRIEENDDEPEDKDGKSRRLCKLSQETRIDKSMQNISRQLEENGGKGTLKSIRRMGALAEVLYKLDEVNEAASQSPHGRVHEAEEVRTASQSPRGRVHEAEEVRTASQSPRRRVHEAEEVRTASQSPRGRVHEAEEVRTASQSRRGRVHEAEEVRTKPATFEEAVLDITAETNFDAEWQRRMEQKWDEDKPWLIRASLENVEKLDAIKFITELRRRQARAGRKFTLEQRFFRGGQGMMEVNNLYFEQDAGKVSVEASIIANSKVLQVKMPGCMMIEKVQDIVMNEKKSIDEMKRYVEKMESKSQEMIELNKVIRHVMDARPHEAEVDNLYDPYEFFDDVTGRSLDESMAMEARALEMKFFKQLNVCEKVPRLRAAADGCKVITTRWLDINTGDDKCPNYRSRLVGREIKMDSRLDLFAATPPLESLRLMCSMCATRQEGPMPYRIMAIDVRRAYFYAKTASTSRSRSRTTKQDMKGKSASST